MDALARVQDIPGWLRAEDAAKLYELAKAVEGPVVEIGTYRGKSAILMALALIESGQSRHIFSLDVDRRSLLMAAANARSRKVADQIVFVHGSIYAFSRAYPHVRPSLVFIDGDHTERGVRRDLAVLERITPPGSYLLFHDFADPRNELAEPEIKVRLAVERSWVIRDCDFLGTFGVCGLFMRTAANSVSPPVLAEVSALEPLREQYTHRLRNPIVSRIRQLIDR